MVTSRGRRVPTASRPHGQRSAGRETKVSLWIRARERRLSAKSGRSTLPSRLLTIANGGGLKLCTPVPPPGLLARQTRMGNRNRHTGRVSRNSAHLYRFNSKMLSISTGMPIGNVCTPSALRAGSLSCPNNVSKRSLAPLATCGCWVNDCFRTHVNCQSAASLDVVEAACLIDTGQDHEHRQACRMLSLFQGHIAADYSDDWLAILEGAKPGDIELAP
jgi:hypothetical protein